MVLDGNFCSEPRPKPNDFPFAFSCFVICGGRSTEPLSFPTLTVMPASATATLTSSLVDELRSMVGPDAVIAGPEELLVYECDAYTLEKFLPAIVVLPQTTEQVVAIVKFCATHQ